MNESLNAEDQGRLFGFRMPQYSSNEVLENAKKSALKTDVSKVIQEFQPFDSAEFDKAIQKGLKSSTTDKRLKSSVDKDKQASQQKVHTFYAVQTNHLSPIDRAFYKSNDKNVVVLSDSEANKNKLFVTNQEEELRFQAPKKPDDKIENGVNGLAAKHDGRMDIEREVTSLQKDKETGLCICGRNYVEGDLMILCDGCGVWFHPECINMSKEELKMKEQLGEKEKWFHSIECKQRYTANSFAAVQTKPRRPAKGGKKGSKSYR